MQITKNNIQQTEILMHKALDKVLQRADSIGYGSSVKSVRLTRYKNHDGREHVHATTEVKIRLDETVNDMPELPNEKF